MSFRTSSYSAWRPVAFLEYTNVPSTVTSKTPPRDGMSISSSSWCSNSSRILSVRPTALGA